MKEAPRFLTVKLLLVDNLPRQKITRFFPSRYNNLVIGDLVTSQVVTANLSQ